MKMNNKGFTLIELLIVVAIIAILAAIAIPQFAQYRLKGYNASATSDMHNQRVSEEALFADWQRYGLSANVAALPGPGGYGPGSLVLGPGAVGTLNIITTFDNQGQPRGLQIPTGNGVSAIMSTDPTVVVGTGGSSFTMIAKHLQGDSTFAADSDSTATYKNVVLHAVGDPIVIADAIKSTPDVDDVLALGPTWGAM